MKALVLSFILSVLFCLQVSAKQPPVVIKVGTVAIAKKWSDIYSEVSRLILEKAQLKSRIMVTPYLRVKNGLEDGTIHMSIMFRSADVDTYTVAIGKVREKKIVVLGKRGNHFNSLSSLHGKTVATQRGTHYDADFDKDDKILKQSSNSYEQNILLVLKGRVDGVIGDYQSILTVAKGLGHSPSDFDRPLVLSRKSSWLLLSSSSVTPELRKKIEIAYQSVLNSGQIEKLINTYPSWLKD
ncbi:ABC transporter substrate-binding protein [Halobacteriovorax sp. HLS]|uniref:substrate-binding periplasmic protein n=1 Tax=Halobacteriovorax sp. HLS TaxID=2234000 RepID=UPI000FD9251A|nr:transporter substrate-binding domain-containing protein [Halobacteriovorax sp. HLS]